MDEIESAYRTNITNVFQEIDPRPDWSMEFLRGEPGPVLVRKAKDAQLLVIGTREHVGIGRLLVGSISHYCLSHASCPVVAVPAEAFNAPARILTLLIMWARRAKPTPPEAVLCRRVRRGRIPSC
jgi:hypothetical protein